MFCAKCGKELPEDAAFCPGCGLEQDIKKKRKLDLSFIQNLPKKTKLIAVGAAAALVLVLIACLCLGGNSRYDTPEDAAKAAIIMSQTNNLEDTIGCIPPWKLRELASRVGVSESASQDELIEAWNDYMDGISLIFGSKEPKSVSVIDAAVVKQGYVTDLKWEKFGLTLKEYEAIEDVVYVEVLYELNNAREDTTVICVKSDEYWYLWDIR